MQQLSPFAIAFRLRRSDNPEAVSLGQHIESLAFQLVERPFAVTRRELEAELKRARAFLAAN